MIFEWDTQKNEINVRKHGIALATAARVFADPNRIEFYDAAHGIAEDRFITIGSVHEILYVVYTERGEHIRLISARPATKRERNLYYDRKNRRQ